MTKLSEKILLGRLRGKLGKGYVGLEKKDKFTPEEVLALFFRIFEILGFDSVLEMSQSFPDIIAIESGERVGIEIEPVASKFDHSDEEISKSRKKYDLVRIYMGCFEDDAQIPKEDFRNRGIDGIIELKEYLRFNEKPLKGWSEKDIRGMRKGMLYILKIFMEANKDTLSKEYLRKMAEKYEELEGKKLGGTLSGFSQTENMIWLVRQKGAEAWQFNSIYKKYKDLVTELLSI
jgi:hypothetical protein